MAATGQLFALVDVNNMYVSCETRLQPEAAEPARGRIINNGGCAVARSNDYVELKF